MRGCGDGVEPVLWQRISVFDVCANQTVFLSRESRNQAVNYYPRGRGHTSTQVVL